MKQVLLITLLGILAIVASIFPTLYKAYTAPPGTIYTLEHNHLNDYYYYLSLMRQGYEGNWLLTSRTTPEKFPPIFVQTFFAALGRIAALTGGDLPLTYTLARVVIGFVLLVVIYALRRATLDGRRAVYFCCFLAFFGTAFWYVANGQMITWLAFWTEFDAFYRATFLPHHLMATTCIILSILSLWQLKKGGSYLAAFFFILFGVLAGISNPATLVNYIIVLFVASLFMFISKTAEERVWPTLGVGLVAFSLTTLYFLGVENSTFPWTTYRDLTTLISYPMSLPNYILGMGPGAILALLGIRYFVQKRSNLIKNIMLSWAIVPFFTAKLLPALVSLPNAHFLQVAHFIPLSIIGGAGLASIQRKIAQVAVTILLILYFIPPWFHNIRLEMYRYARLTYNVYVPQEVFAAFGYLNEKSPQESVVVSGKFLGGMIPAFTHNRSVLGHPANTYNMADKEHDVDLFYRQNDPVFARQFLAKYTVSYVVYYFDSPSVINEFVQALGLKRVYQNPRIEIYEVTGESKT